MIIEDIYDHQTKRVISHRFFDGIGIKNGEAFYVEYQDPDNIQVKCATYNFTFISNEPQ